jgi:hypothetical protein
LASRQSRRTLSAETFGTSAAPHQLRGDGEEAGAVLPAHLPGINQAQVRLVY